MHIEQCTLLIYTRTAYVHMNKLGLLEMKYYCIAINLLSIAISLLSIAISLEMLHIQRNLNHYIVPPRRY